MEEVTRKNKKEEDIEDTLKKEGEKKEEAKEWPAN